MPVFILPLFVIVISRTRAGSCTRADKSTFLPANQRPCTCTDGCADANAFRRLLLSGLRISMTSVLAASNGNYERERQHQQQN